MNGNGCAEDRMLILDPTAEEEGRARSRYVFAWAFGVGISTTGAREDGAMEVDVEPEEGQGGEAELVWAESEGDFTRHEVSSASLY